MGVRSTTSCSQFGHPEFELDVGDLGDELTTSLVRYLEGAVSRGTRFEPGQTIQFGFQCLEVRDAHDRLTLFAPERSLASVILATLRQKFVADSFGMSERLDFPSPRDEALGCTANSRPEKPPATRLCKISEPILPRSRLAPMTATAFGAKKLSIDAVAAACDRAAARSS